MIIDTNYKKAGINAEYAKYKPTDKLIIFDDIEQAKIFADFINASTIFEVTDGFLVSVFGSFVTTTGWYDMLLEAKRRYNLQYNLV